MGVLENYLQEMQIEVEPFALCLIDSGWRLTLPGPPVAMLHFIVQGEGWVICPDRPRQRIGPNFLIIIPPGAIHSLESTDKINDELRIECAPEGPPVHRIRAGSGDDLHMVVGCGTSCVHIGETFGLFDRLDQTLVVDLSDNPEVPILYQGLISGQAAAATGKPVLQGAIMKQLLMHVFLKMSEQKDTSLSWLTAFNDPGLVSALAVILDDPCAEHSIESLASAANMGVSEFTQSFQDGFGYSPITLTHKICSGRAQTPD
jgi:AraC family transcriptional activator of mtrCDE